MQRLVRRGHHEAPAHSVIVPPPGAVVSVCPGIWPRPGPLPRHLQLPVRTVPLRSCKDQPEVSGGPMEGDGPTFTDEATQNTAHFTDGPRGTTFVSMVIVVESFSLDS